MKNHGAKLLRMTLLLLAALTLLACKKDEEVAATPSPTVQAQTESFQQSLEGIWSAEENQGDDAETLYAIEWLPDLGLRVVRDGAWLDGKVEDVDLDNLTLALHLASQTGPSETVTLRKVPEKDAAGPFTLRITWRAGQTERLGFVRRLTDRDRGEIAEAIKTAKAQDEPVACDTDARAGSVRATLVCGHEEFAAIDAGMRKQFTELAYRYPEGDRTVMAATKQLDACATPACLRTAYAQWQAYFDENYDLGVVEDYR